MFHRTYNEYGLMLDDGRLQHFFEYAKCYRFEQSMDFCNADICRGREYVD